MQPSKLEFKPIENTFSLKGHIYETLRNGIPGGSAFLIGGLARIDFPFYGGTLVPDPLFLVELKRYRDEVSGVFYDHDEGLLLLWPIGTARVLALLTTRRVDQAQMRRLVQSKAHWLAGDRR